MMLSSWRRHAPARLLRAPAPPSCLCTVSSLRRRGMANNADLSLEDIARPCVTETGTVAGRLMSLSVGAVAPLTDGAVLARYGDTVVLGTAVMKRGGGAPDADFLALTVDHRDRLSAAGAIPASPARREARETERETLVARAVDRSLRPLFADGLFSELHVTTGVHSLDPDADADALAVTAASAALLTSSIPWGGPTAGVRVGWVDGAPVVFPTASQMARSSLSLLYAGAGDCAIMLEVEARQLRESDVMAAVRAAHAAAAEVVALQRALAARVGRAKRDLRLVVPSPELYAAVRAVAYGDAKGMFGAQKRTRSVTQGKIMSRVMEVVGAAFPGTPPLLLRIACDQVVQEALRDRMLEAGTPAPRAPPGSLVSGVGSRPDGRDSRTVRPVSGAVGLLPRAHGSSLFTRGSTQVLVATTLGDPDTGALSVQAPTGLGASRRSFYLHYDFPPYCTNEVGKPGMNRRMVGHGALAERALAGVVMPPGPGGAPSAFPYAVRVSSEVTASDGSSSMATVCGATLALQDAGVPLAAPVAGVSIGLVTPRDMAADRRYLLLTDILGLEDHVGDMDFKVAGTAAGVTAIQLDVKLEGGLPLAILEDALGAARTARVAVLGAMTDVIAASRAAPRATAPRTERVTLEASSRGILVNNFSAVLRRLQDETGAKMALDGHSLDVFGSPLQVARVRELLAAAITEYNGRLPVVGARTRVRVVVVRDFGAQVEAVGGGAPGVVHVSELRHTHTMRAADVLTEGDEFDAIILDVDAAGRAKYSRKACLPQGGPSAAAAPAAGAAPAVAAAPGVGAALAVRLDTPPPAVVAAAPPPATTAAAPARAPAKPAAAVPAPVRDAPARAAAAPAPPSLFCRSDGCGAAFSTGKLRAAHERAHAVRGEKGRRGAPSAMPASAAPVAAVALDGPSAHVEALHRTGGRRSPAPATVTVAATTGGKAARARPAEAARPTSGTAPGAPGSGGSSSGSKGTHVPPTAAPAAARAPASPAPMPTPSATTADTRALWAAYARRVADEESLMGR